MKIRIPHRPIDIVLFLLLAFLCYQGHQLTRHLTGAVLCGGFGTMTFTVATTRQPCTAPTLLTLSGPVFTYGLAYLGMVLLLARKTPLFAYALIFASFSHLRFIQNLIGQGDELILAQQWFGVTNRAIVAAVVFLIGLPPMIVAYRAIANRRRALVFTGSWLLPLPVLVVLLFGSAFLFEKSDVGTRLGAFLGIWVTVLITDLLLGAVFLLLLNKYSNTER